MIIRSPAAMSRRTVLETAGLGGMAALASPLNRAHAATPAGAIRLAPAPATTALLGTGRLRTRVWAYNGSVPGPVLRLRQGHLFQSVVRNGLAEATTVHWHGIRLPNAMDGVPGLTQKAIPPGGQFLYAFTPPDAGTFWYHPHADSARQIGHGLSGALIVEEPHPPAIDQDLLWVLQDWSLEGNGQLLPGFDSFMQAAMAGRLGGLVTINGRVPTPVAVQAGARVRLRLINACLARIMALRFTGHRPRVIALDGQPVAHPFEPAGGRLLLGPAQRAEVILDANGEPGQRYAVIDDFYGPKLTYRLAEIAYAPTRATGGHAADAPLVLPANPVPAPDLDNPIAHTLTIVGGMMGGTGGAMGGMMGGMGSGQRHIWGIESGGRMDHRMAPAFTIPRGRTCLITLRNHTAWWHPMHLHGFSFHVLSRNGIPEPHPHCRDTVLLAPRDTVQFAFVADNLGLWMFHCHVIEHQENGLMMVIRVA
ncbi:MAG TPA: multicopper oxidase family protein [Acetobacteraceae bacterium]|nr:multicopper oxidase family protein [Acetobacteraceae bacterium]